MTRLRSRPVYTTGGPAYWQGVLEPPVTWLTARHNCQDEPGPGDCLPFAVEHREMDGGLMYRDPNSNWNYKPLGRPYSQGGLLSHQHQSVPLMSDGAAAAEAVKRTNPSRPYVDVGTFLAELKDIPSLLRLEGNALRRWFNQGSPRTKSGLVDAGLHAGAGYYLKYSFGIAPMVSDIVKMLKCGDRVDRRFKLLKRMQNQGIGKTVMVDEGSVFRGGVQTVQSVGLSLSLRWNGSTTAKKRVYTRWYGSSQNYPTSDRELYLQALRSVYGLTLDFSTAWELMPWSWLIDWFSNVGDVVAGSRNIVNASLGPVAVMTEMKTNVAYEGHDSSYVRATPRKVSVVTKNRSRSYPTVQIAGLPMLTHHQTAILGSVAVKKRLIRFK